ncbi:GNAT family N-acetyltransferase [Terriglobus tenax]|uniref:GNAT family N-acetyltransferase n=1 Tax=Terriglobus tenax TaxID=1111115 RepID=UPI0021DF4D3B|nr:GNAT family N-acetyltransferase [Terriglobus tenax]
MATAVLAPVVVQPAVWVPADAVLQAGPYRARLAVTEADRLAVYRLRFVVFNLELNEGCEAAFATGHDRDRFDDVCDHILVERVECGSVIGTYRLQTGLRALQAHGYYSAQEFDLSPYEVLRERTIELGRACIHRDHRSPEVLNLLWKAIARYAKERNARWMMGCCSLNSQDAVEGWSVFHGLREYQVEESLRTLPLEALRMQRVEGEIEAKQPPKLLRSYLALGARICGEPAIDREFRTIDFLTLMDLERLHPRMAVRLFG